MRPSVVAVSAILLLLFHLFSFIFYCETTAQASAASLWNNWLVRMSMCMCDLHAQYLHYILVTKLCVTHTSNVSIQRSLRKVGKATKYNNFHMINYLRLRASRWNTNGVIAFGGGCCCLGTQSCNTIIQKYFDDRPCSGISEQPKQHFKCCATRSVRWLVKLSRPIVQSHITFFDAHGGIYSVNVLPLQFMHIFSYREEVYPTQLCALFKSMRILAFPFNFFFYAIFQNAHKNRWMKT